MISYNNLISHIYTITNTKDISKWIIKVAENEGYKMGYVIYIFTSDEYLISINRKFLLRDTYTDIITFPTSEYEKIISGEIYISLDRVIENAKKFKKKYSEEFARVLVHGVLHLVGYDDITEGEKHIMREKENYYINLQSSKLINCST